MNYKYTFKDVSGWTDGPDSKQPHLDSHQKADVVVVGGGYTGLSTALNLKERGMDVALLDQGFAGSGASGRNAGHVAPTIGKDIPSLLKKFGEERTKGLINYAETAVDHTEETIKKYAIECEYKTTGNMVCGLLPEHISKLQETSDIAQSLGAKVSFYDTEHMSQRKVPGGFTCGMLEEPGGSLHPGKYVMGLRRAALESGVRIYEDSQLTSLEDGAKVKAITASGSISADNAVLATNAYTNSTGWHKNAVVPVRVTLFETKPLSSEQLESLGWIYKEGIYTAHEVLENYQLTASNTIIGGTKQVNYSFGSALGNGYNEKTFKVLENAFRQRFPTLRDVEIAQWWGGWIGFTTDLIPSVGTTGKHKNIHHGFGYAGHGVPQATMMGSILADIIEGKENRWEEVLRRKHMNWPPEPFRWVGAKTSLLTLGALDRRTDKKIQKLHKTK